MTRDGGLSPRPLVAAHDRLESLSHGRLRARCPRCPHGACALMLVLALVLAGCGGLPSEPEVTGATVVFAAFEGPEQDAPTIRSVATVIIGGVRAQFDGPRERELIVRNIPFGDEDPPRQPMTVTAPGYRTVGQQLTLRRDMATFVDLTMESVSTAQTGTIQGAVRASTGEPIVNALVSFDWEQDGTPASLDGFTDREGRFIIGGIPIGPATVEAVAAGYLPQTTQVQVLPDDGGTNPELTLSLLAGETTVVVRGVVRELRTEGPLEGAQVAVADHPPAVTGADGRFSIPEVLVGPRTLVVTLAGYDRYEATINVLPGMGDVVVLMSRVSSEPPDGPHTISGQVTLLGNPTNEGAVVAVFDLERGREMAETVTDAEGRYYLFVPPGRYEITVTFGERSISRELTYPGGGRVIEGIDFTLSV